jgi:hypothetical protein
MRLIKKKMISPCTKNDLLISVAILGSTMISHCTKNDQLISVTVCGSTMVKIPLHHKNCS